MSLSLQQRGKCSVRVVVRVLLCAWLQSDGRANSAVQYLLMSDVQCHTILIIIIGISTRPSSLHAVAASLAIVKPSLSRQYAAGWLLRMTDARGRYYRASFDFVNDVSRCHSLRTQSPSRTVLLYGPPSLPLTFIVLRDILYAKQM